MRKLVTGAVALAAMALAPGSVTAKGAQAGSAHDFTFQSIDGKPMPLAAFRGKVLLVVNTASFCGFTRQYQGLQALWERFEAAGLVVIGVPSNDFGEQEPKGESEIKAFCQGAFGVTFPLTAKVAVQGKDAHPFYAWARETLGAAAAPGWNFHKYLVGADGRLVQSFTTLMSPDSTAIVTAIEAELAKARAAPG
jgi:glutathione peroxidase